MRASTILILVLTALESALPQPNAEPKYISYAALQKDTASGKPNPPEPANPPSRGCEHIFRCRS